MARDSLLRTQVFNWPSGATLQYFRAMNASDSNAIKSGGIFWSSSIKLKYQVELVHSGGAIDTIELLTWSPFDTDWIPPTLVTLTNTSGSSEDVYLRARLVSICGVPDDTTSRINCFFTEIPFHCADTVSYKRGAGLGQLEHGALSVGDLFPNPVLQSKGSFSFFAAYATGRNLRATIIDVLGREVSIPLDVTTTGLWQLVKMNAPQTQGSYFLKLTAGNDNRMLPFSVLK